MSVLKNVKISWVKIKQNSPDMGEDGDTPTWQCTAEVTADFYKKWNQQKIGGSKKHDDGTFTVNFKRKAKPFPNGDPKEAPKCLTGAMKPLDPGIVGNGSVANIQYSIYEWTYGKAKKQGKSADLAAIQVLNLVKFEGGGEDGGEFEVVGEDSNELSSQENDIPFEPDTAVNDGEIY